MSSSTHQVEKSASGVSTGLKKEESKMTPPRSVRFSPGTKISSSTKRNPVPRKNPAKFGKANPIRDLGVLVGFLGFLLLIAYGTRNVGKPRDDAHDIKELKEALQKRIIKKAQEEKRRKRKTECGLFLAQSSVPGAGFGLFAGKKMAKGDNVLHSDGNFPVGDQLVSQYGLLLKHHPRLANLEKLRGETDDRVEESVFRASRAIEPGEELFLDINDHPQKNFSASHPIFAHIPLPQDYEIANDIVQDMIRHQNQYRGSKQRTGGSGASTTLQMARKAVTRVNRKVGSLLPTTGTALKEIDALAETISLAGLKNRTIFRLEVDGHCLDDVEVKLQAAGSPDDVALVAKRPIKRGESIVVSPIYATRIDQTCTIGANKCSERAHRCLGHNESTVLLCPLSTAAFLLKPIPGDSDPSPIVEFRWSSWNKAVDKAKALPPSAVIQDFALSLTLDVVALRDIKTGEKITTRDGPGAVADSIFPIAWKDAGRVEVY